MRATPDWLPELASLAGPVDMVVRQLYAIFHRDIVRGSLVFQGAQVWWDRRSREVFGLTYEETFWHLVSREDRSGGARELDPPRAERLPWFAPTIRHIGAEPVLAWDYLEASGKINTYVWLRDWDYVIVVQRRVQRRGEVYFLLTAYHVDGPSTVARLHGKYERRLRDAARRMQSPPRRTAKDLFLHMVDEADTIIAKSATLSNKSAVTSECVSARVRIPPGPESVIVTATQTECYMTADVSRVLADRPVMMTRWADVHPDCISSGANSRTNSRAKSERR
ncbi:MAG: hypothetical protein NTX53_06775 [candidate division WOR-3 bacterium]|nr:hypothetical protein [candidate division WOR-3 bacterium]